MAVTVDISEETLRRLEAEAERRGVGIDVVVAELAQALPAPPADLAPDRNHRFAFAGVAASGDGTLSQRYKEIRRAEFGS